MIAKQTLFLITVLTLGCGPTNTSNNGSIDGFKNGTPSETTGGGMSLSKTVEGSGFSVQAPAGWTVLPVGGSGVSIASPFDLAKEVAPTPVSIMIIPSQGTVQPTEMAAALFQNNRGIGDVESETQIKVAGHDTTKLVLTMTNRVQSRVAFERISFRQRQLRKVVAVTDVAVRMWISEMAA